MNSYRVARLQHRFFWLGFISVYLVWSKIQLFTAQTDWSSQPRCQVIWARGYKTFFMLNSAEHEIFPAHKCLNANNCWNFNIYEQENSIISISEPEKCWISCDFYTDEHLKFHAQLSLAWKYFDNFGDRLCGHCRLIWALAAGIRILGIFS